MGISRDACKRYVNLHNHTTFSYGDGFGRVDEHVARAVEVGSQAVVATEHGNVSSWVQLEKAAVKQGIKPVFGLEAYTAPPKTDRKFHQILLARDMTGLRNLNQLVSRSWAEGFYRWPTIHGEMMVKHAEGLIATSGCADSHLNCVLAGGKSLGDRRDRISTFDMANAERLVRKYQELFGDGYYLEVQRFPGLDRTRLLNPALAELSARTGVPLVATADSHYPFGHQNEMQKILHAAHRGGTVDQVEASWEYDILLTPPTSDAEIYHNLIATGLTKSEAWSAILSTEEIAQRCNVVLPKNKSLRFPLPDGWSAHELLWEWLREGWKYRFPDNPRMQANPDEYVRRLHYEMDLIDSKDYNDYFLMVADAVRYAKDLRPRPIPVGPARGSAAASVVLYMLRTTEVDPLQFPSMVFERFIDVSRKDLPDIDLDFADTRRDEVRAYLVRRYGADRVANIGNFVGYKGKIAIADVSRVHKVPKADEEAVKAVILERSGGDSRYNDSLADSIAMFPAAQAAFDRNPQLKYAIALEGNQRGMSIHAAGIVISNTPITDTCAMYTREVNGEQRSVLAYDKKDAESLGMLKMDFLGLSTMGMIDLVLEMIGMDLADLYRVPLDEPRTLDAFRRGDVVGIFQFEGRATRLVNAGVVPDHFQHLADINALSRPGPLFSGMTADYIDVKHGRKKADHLHPLVWEHTEFTYGQIIYQEQVLKIVSSIGGFPVERIGDIRRIISQKLGEASMQTMFEDFVRGAADLHDIDRKLATRIWKFMVTSATYSFNIAHCRPGSTRLARAKTSDEITLGEIWRAVNFYKEGVRGGGAAAKGIRTNIGPCLSCGADVKKIWTGQCSRCRHIRKMYETGGLTCLSVDANGRVFPNVIQKVFNNGTQTLHRIQLSTGQEIEATGDHRWMTVDGDWITTDALRSGQLLAYFDRYKMEASPTLGGGPNAGRMKAGKTSRSKCAHCGARGRLDVSHKDGNRRNDAMDNLWYLCRSCHTIWDRDNHGRTLDPWSKGRTLSIVQVVAVDRHVSVEDVFTLEMDRGVGHNYVTEDGMVNKNCVSYSMLGFWCQWLKQYYPREFYAAQLLKVGDDKKARENRRPRLLNDAVKNGFTILPPDPTLSAVSWAPDRVDPKGIRAGFLQIPKVGATTAKAIVNYRDNFDLLDWDDLRAVKGIGPTTIARLEEFVSAEDPFEIELTAKTLDLIRTGIAKRWRDYRGLPKPTHKSHEIPRDRDCNVTWLGVVRNIEYKDLIEDERARTGDSIEDIIKRNKDPHLVKSATLHCYDDGDDDVYIRVNRWKFPKFESLINTIIPRESVVLVMGRKRSSFGVSLQVEALIVLTPDEEKVDEVSEG